MPTYSAPLYDSSPRAKLFHHKRDGASQYQKDSGASYVKNKETKSVDLRQLFMTDNAALH